MDKTVRILGTRGVPAAHGGFETAAENIAAFLVAGGWRVVVYCQVVGKGSIRYDTWHGIERVLVPVSSDDWRSTGTFDLRSVRHASQFRDICLTFGYNTAIFNVLQRLRGIPNIINMDGMEWARARWGPMRRAFLYGNERIACVIGHHLIADHPEIAKYLTARAPKQEISMIAYGAPSVTEAPINYCVDHNLRPGQYLTLIARPILENSILEIVEGFSVRPRGYDLAILGNYSVADPYHRKVLDAAGPEVKFLGALYDPAEVQALRLHSVAYVHGHTVGGTNPSLVEAMGAGNAIIAHDNRYNRWVAQEAAVYFRNATDIDELLEEVLASPERAKQMQLASRHRHSSNFTWNHVAGQYEELLLRYLS